MERIPILVVPKGAHYLGLGSTAILCRVGAEVHKIPLSFILEGCEAQEIKQKRYEEEDSQSMIDREIQIYQHLGRHPGILECLEASKTQLRFPYMKYGDLRQYLQNPLTIIDAQQKRDWTIQALEAVAFIHSMGVLQADISARNLLVASDLSLKLCDFAGSSFNDLPALVLEETRYRKLCGVIEYENTITTEIFALGSLIFEIMSGVRPYDCIEDEEVESRYRNMIFPPTDGLKFSCVIRKCWLGEYSTVDEILRDILVQDNTSTVQAPPSWLDSIPR